MTSHTCTMLQGRMQCGTLMRNAAGLIRHMTTNEVPGVVYLTALVKSLLLAGKSPLLPGCSWVSTLPCALMQA